MYGEVSVKHVRMQAHPNVPVVENMEDIWKVGKLQRERERKAELAAKAQARKEVVEAATKAQKSTVTSVPKDAREEGNIQSALPCYEDQSIAIHQMRECALVRVLPSKLQPKQAW